MAKTEASLKKRPVTMFRSKLSRALWAACSPLRKARYESRLSAGQIAESAGVAENTLRAYERGIRSTPVSVICAVATLLGQNPALLCCDYQVWSAMKPEKGENGQQD